MGKSEQLDAIINQLVHATDPEEIQAAYAAWADSYEQDLGFYGYLAPQIGAQHLADALPDKAARILDAGCGTGLVGVALAERGYSDIDGVDFSAEMLEKAKSTEIYRGVFSADFYQPLPQFSDNSYDAIILIGVYYTALKQYLVPELLRIVKPGGIIVISSRLQYYASDLQLQAQQFETDGVATILKESQQTYMAGQDADAVYLVLQKSMPSANRD